MIRRSERKRRRPVFFSPSRSSPIVSRLHHNHHKPHHPQSEKRTNKRSRKLVPTRQCSLDELPPEVLEMVLRFLPYREIAGTIRLVSKKCAAVATALLNSVFLSSGQRIHASLEKAESLSMAPKSSELERAIQSRVYNCLELVRAQYQLLKACCWRYTHPTSDRSFGRLCFYGGAILDELDQVLDDAKRNPARLIGTKDTDMPSRSIVEFSLLCKAFMNHFEKVSERRVNKSSLISGCKAVDVLDCLLIGRDLLSWRMIGSPRGSNVVDENSTTTSVSMKIRYVLRRAWFTCLEVPNDNNNCCTDDSWRDQQRFMYLRLRRLVGIVNEHYLEKRHYDRELVYSADLLPPPRPLPCSTYSGYGECGGRFYYYGNMNEYAFDSKIIEVWRKNSTRDRQQRKIPEDRPCYDLVINVELKCSPDLAPLSVRPMLKCDNLDSSTSTIGYRPHMYLKLSISCPASVSNRLPGYFVWELRSPRRHRK